MAAFERLWADVHPALIRYLRVVAVADADDIACESWVAVVRRLRTFDGDETAWRSLVFSAARMHAEDENQRRVWDAMVEDDQLAAVVAEPLPAGEEPFDADELEDGPAHGLRLAIEAIRDLPPQQGDVLMLRRMAELPVEEVAALVGADLTAVHGLEQQALDQLGLDAELLQWALAAEARPVELADEATVVEVFRAAVPEQPAPSVVGGSAGPSGARVIAFRPPTWRARAGAVAAASAAVVGMGAISAAAYQGVLPDPVQNVMHVVIGAPEPTPEASTSSAAAKPRTTRHSPASRPVSTSAGHSASSKAGALQRNAAVGLCRTWEREREQLVPQARSTAFVKLAGAAGGSAKVNPYCLTVGVPLAPLTATTAGPGATTSPTATPTSPVPTTKPETAKPTTTPTKPATTTPTKPPTTTPAPTTTTTPVPTTAPPPTTTTADSGSGGSGGDGSGAGAGGAAPQGDGSGGSAGSANRSTNAPADGGGQVKVKE